MPRPLNSEAAEPDIYHAIRRDALLENVVVRADGTIDFDDGSKPRTPVSPYPIDHIENIVSRSRKRAMPPKLSS